MRRAHTFTALLGGLFLVLHVAYLISYPMNGAIVLGYIAVAVALFLGLTGMSYLQRFREARFYHGSISLAAIALMAIHAVGSGFNLPAWIAAVTLVGTASLVFTMAAAPGRQDASLGVSELNRREFIRRMVVTSVLSVTGVAAIVELLARTGSARTGLSASHNHDPDHIGQPVLLCYPDAAGLHAAGVRPNRPFERH